MTTVIDLGHEVPPETNGHETCRTVEISGKSAFQAHELCIKPPVGAYGLGLKMHVVTESGKRALLSHKMPRPVGITTPLGHEFETGERVVVEAENPDTNAHFVNMYMTGTWGGGETMPADVDIDCYSGDTQAFTPSKPEVSGVAYECNVCGEGFPTDKKRNEHIENAHSL